jgi:hypothetical protein
MEDAQLKMECLTKADLLEERTSDDIDTRQNVLLPRKGDLKKGASATEAMS